MSPVVRNCHQPWELSEARVTDALLRLQDRDEGVGSEAKHVYDTLTWGEGPAQIRLAAVQPSRNDHFVDQDIDACDTVEPMRAVA